MLSFFSSLVRFEQELQRVVELQHKLEQREAELQAAHAAARAAALEATGLDGDELAAEEDVPASTLRCVDTAQNAPWLPALVVLTAAASVFVVHREFEELRGSVVSLWERLDVPPEDVVSFLSECDMLAPYHPKVLELYQTMHKELTGRPDVGHADASASVLAASALPPAPAVSAPPRPPSPDWAAGGGGGGAGASTGVTAAGGAMRSATEGAALLPSPIKSSRTPASSGARRSGGRSHGGSRSKSRSRPKGSPAASAAPAAAYADDAPKSRAQLYDTYKKDVTSRLYKPVVTARARALRAKAQRSTRGDWGSGPGKHASSRAVHGPASPSASRRRSPDRR